MQECPKGKYGQNCSQICHCYENSTCDPKNGKCILLCEKGMKGENCTDRSCPDGLYGEKCDDKCQCVIENTIS